MDLIKEHNGQVCRTMKTKKLKMIPKADAGVHSFHLGENSLADLSTDEIRIRFNGFVQR